MKYFLTIAASDSSCGAGIQQDIRVAELLNYRPLSVITAITSQNDKRVENVFPLNSEVIRSQIDALAGEYEIVACKVGVLVSKEHIYVISNFLKTTTIAVKVVDPVFTSSSGYPFIERSLLSEYVENILPVASFITPNKNELELIINQNIRSIDEAIEAALILHTKYGCGIYIKGGHFACNDVITEAIIYQNKINLIKKKKNYYHYSHGTGCAFSTALSCYLGANYTPYLAAKKATTFTSNFFKKINQKLK